MAFSGGQFTVTDTAFSCQNVKVFRLPTMKHAGGHRASDWQQNLIWTGLCKVIITGTQATVRLEDPVTGELFGQAPVPVSSDASRVIEPAVDSSRYFVLRLEDQGRHAFVGLGFEEREDAFDFKVALTDHKKQTQQAQTNAPVYTGPKQDLSLKEGERITVNLGGKVKKQADKVLGQDGPPPPSGGLPPPPGGAGSGGLAPPPGAGRTARQTGRTKASSPVPAAAPAQPAGAGGQWGAQPQAALAPAPAPAPAPAAGAVDFFSQPSTTQSAAPLQQLAPATAPFSAQPPVQQPQASAWDAAAAAAPAPPAQAAQWPPQQQAGSPRHQHDDPFAPAPAPAPAAPPALSPPPVAPQPMPWQQSQGMPGMGAPGWAQQAPAGPCAWRACAPSPQQPFAPASQQQQPPQQGGGGDMLSFGLTPEQQRAQASTSILGLFNEPQKQQPPQGVPQQMPPQGQPFPF
eukprot:TRINITY_DN7718_c0_g4_i1.p1 TRINITY_DN7718_c0_g4~~TRINITY_DN7718_c0_g4_i1.p1  ORF type:complete len:495 (+),score=108.86 TRINITY_DN7718_c0_g4_i1:111-1487(+)